MKLNNKLMHKFILQSTKFDQLSIIKTNLFYKHFKSTNSFPKFTNENT